MPIKQSTNTPFGQYLVDRGLSYHEAAAELDISYAYVGALARGDLTPSLSRAFAIGRWSGGRVPVQAWEDWCR